MKNIYETTVHGKKVLVNIQRGTITFKDPRIVKYVFCKEETNAIEEIIQNFLNGFIEKAIDKKEEK